MMMQKKPKVEVKQIGVKTVEGENLSLTFKKHKNTNEYLRVGNYWIRNFSGESLRPIDINNFYYNIPLQNIIDNEMRNGNLRHPQLEPEIFSKYTNLLIVSDGLGFYDNHELFKSINSSTCVITVNQAARFWNASIFPDYFLVNNPDDSCLVGLPIKRFPKLIASRKTSHSFLQKYKNIVCMYDAVPDDYYESHISKNSEHRLDDYRNPICAAISLANKFFHGNIFLAFCSSAYKEQREGTVEIEPGVYQYPPQKTADEIIDGNLFWYRAGHMQSKIFHTGIKNSYKFSKYVEPAVMAEIIK